MKITHVKKKLLHIVLQNMRIDSPSYFFFILFNFNSVMAAPYYLGAIEDKSAITKLAPLVCPKGIACKPKNGILLPSEKDWSVFVTSVKDQGQCGSCVVFATTAALESALLKQNKGAYDISEQYGLSCLLPPTLCDNGVEIGDYVNLLKSSGSSEELWQYPYIANYGNCNSAKQFLTAYNFPYKATAFQKVGIGSINDLKSTLVQYGPVVASFDVYTSFFHYETGLYRPNVLDVHDVYEGLHAVLVVGYSDKMGGFRVKNSWGTHWGENGFFWMAYDQVLGISKFGTRGDGVFAITDTFMPTQPKPTPAQIIATTSVINSLLLDDDEPCRYQLTSANQSIASVGGAFTATINTGGGANCDWDLSSDKSWLVFASTPSGKGNSTMGFNVAANTTYAKRTDTITLTSPKDVNVNKTLQINQAANPGVSIVNVSVKEGAANTTTDMLFTVKLNTPATKTITVNYATKNGTAVAPTDYNATSGTLSFLKGETVKNLVVKIKGDAVREANETFSLVLSAPTAPYTLQVTQAIGTITNDD